MMGRRFFSLTSLGLVSLALSFSASSAPAAEAEAEAEIHRVSPPVLDDVTSLCALLSGCTNQPVSPSVLADDFASCVKRYAPALGSPAFLGVPLSVRECGLHATSCSVLRDCLLRGVKAEACVGRGKSGSSGMCDTDGRAVICAKEKVLAVRDCPRGGEHCRVRDGEAVCVLDRCTEADGAKPKCLGSKKVGCDKGFLVSVDCAVLDLVCEEGAEGAACVPKGAVCKQDRCLGDTAVGCFAGKEVGIDCAKAGQTCVERAGAFGRCKPPKSDAGPLCGVDGFRCEGAIIKGCYGATPISFPCGAVGLKRCETFAKGVRCAP